MSFSVAFALPAHRNSVGAGLNPFTQSGPTLDLAFAGATQVDNTFVGASLKLNFLTQSYQYPAQYSVWVNNVGLTAKSFSDVITFTRASSGTYVNSNGYVSTATSDVPRFGYDPTSVSLLGFLVEESRTNLLPYSDSFSAYWTYSNAVVNTFIYTTPDGAAQGLFLQPSGAGTVEIYYAVTKAATAIQYSQSIWVRNDIGEALPSFSLSLDDGTVSNRGVAVFNITSAGVGTLVSTASEGTFSNTSATITSYVNGWFRITLTTTSNTATTVRFRLFYTATPTVFPNAFLWGAQLEKGAYTTSFIYTNGATATRAADLAAVNTLSPWYNSAAGTLYTEAVLEAPPNLAGNQLSALSDGTNNNRIQLGASTISGGNLNFLVTAAGVAQANPLVGSITTTGPHKVAGAYILNSFQVAVNGTLGVEDVSGSVPSGVNVLQIGTAGNPSTKGNLWVRRITYYGRRLTDQELRSVTA